MNSESLLQPLFFIGFYLHHKSPIKKAQIDPSMKIKKSWPIFLQNVNLNYETLKYAHQQDCAPFALSVPFSFGDVF